MGIRCSIDSLDLEFDALFNTGTSHTCLKPELIEKISKQFQVLDTPPGYPPLYVVPLIIHLDSHNISRHCVVHKAEEGDDNLIPPRVFTGEYSITFVQSQTNKKNYVTFKPKESTGGVKKEYKILFNKETGMTMPSGTPGFYFSIGGNLETALFDTGSLINVVDSITADKIRIEKYPPAKPLDLDLDIPSLPSGIPAYLLPISLPGVVSFVTPVYTSDQTLMNAMNIISAPQFLLNRIEFTLHEHSASFTNLGPRMRSYSSWIINHQTMQ